MSHHLKELLRNFGLKVTEARLQVLQVLINSDEALSHSDIQERMDDAQLDKVTLYRTLSAFEEKGLAHKVATEDLNWRYAVHLEHSENGEPDEQHAHFVCNKCDRIYCFPVEGEDNVVTIQQKEGFVIKEQEIRLHGLCPDCKT